MKHNDERIILIPPSQVRDGDTGVFDPEWAQHYQYMIWVAEVMREYMNREGYTYRLADIEMALFMMGK